jgi:hypothetical protein
MEEIKARWLPADDPLHLPIDNPRIELMTDDSHHSRDHYVPESCLFRVQRNLKKIGQVDDAPRTNSKMDFNTVLRRQKSQELEPVAHLDEWMDA